MGFFLAIRFHWGTLIGMGKPQLLIGIVAVVVITVVIGLLTATPSKAPTTNEELGNVNEFELTNQLANANEQQELTGALLVAAQARDDQRLADIRVLQAAMEAYKNDQVGALYPGEMGQLVPDYVPQLPKDPLTDQEYSYTPIGSGPNFYDLVYTLEVGVQGVSDGEHSATPSGIATP